MIVRAWEEKDIDVIVEIEKRCFSDPWTREALADCLRYPYYRCFLAEERGQVCGYCCLIVLFEDSEVANIAVDIPCRGWGIGRRLMQTMHEEAKRLGATRSLLEVRVGNAPAIAMYEGFGYEKYGVRAHYYEDGEDAALMEKQL